MPGAGISSLWHGIPLSFITFTNDRISDFEMPGSPLSMITNPFGGESAARLIFPRNCSGFSIMGPLGLIAMSPLLFIEPVNVIHIAMSPPQRPQPGSL